ncbi:glycosyltransferase [Rheinheimera baltica]|uniref:glycosyltransferase n=1 Tax=Rheinheimera baltica TaxID=67576 RepID=UPI00273D60F8|nr:glycosyltransferase [Rheinheimera baltica]MDP5189001.1 glycosyltransferase [Rheinheimera baltica]
MTTAVVQPLASISRRVILLANHSVTSSSVADGYATFVQTAAKQWHAVGAEVVVFDCFGPVYTDKEPIQDGIYYLQLGLTPQAAKTLADTLAQTLSLYKPTLLVSCLPEYLLAAASQVATTLGLPLVADLRCYNDATLPALPAELLSACTLVLSNNVISGVPQVIDWPLTQPELAAELAPLIGVGTIQSRINPQQLKLSRVLQQQQQQAEPILPVGGNPDSWIPVDDSTDWQTFTLAALSTVAIHGAVRYEATGTEMGRKAVLLIKLCNNQGERLKTPCAGLNWSEVFDSHFVYLPDSQSKDKQIVSWVLPDSCVSVALCVRGFYLKAPAKVYLQQMRLYQDNKQALLLEQWNYINHYFYNKGEVTFVRSRLERLLQQACTPEQLRLGRQVLGLYQVKQGITLPKRQPDALYTPRANTVLYCLHQSLPYVTNGYATRSHGIATGLAGAGWQVNVATRPGFPWDSQDIMAATSYHKQHIDGICYTAYNGSYLEDVGLASYIAITADHFCREAQHSRAGLIIAASNHVTSIPALIAARRLGIPFVYELRGLWHLTKGSLRPDWASSERFQLEHQLELLVAAEADHVFTLTDELSKVLTQAGVNTPVNLAPNAVDCSVFYPREADINVRKQLDIADDALVIGYAGSAVGYEGLDVLMEALAILARQGENFVFVLLGDGAVLEQVKLQAQQLNISRYCRFAGRVAFADVARFISNMDVMPIPRRKSAVTEVVSALKPLEAMAMAKTLVLSDVSPHYEFAGAAKQILDGDTGVRLHQRAVLCRHDDARSLASALKYCLADSGRREALGSAALNWIRQHRTWQAVTQQYSDTIQPLLQQHNAMPNKPGKSKPVIAVIADEFSLTALSDAAELICVTPQNWQQQLSNTKVDALLVESAWNGNSGQWHRMIGHYDDTSSAALRDMLTFCRAHQIPSLFWNKEDPVHFDRFAANAVFFDHVFSSDADCLHRYLNLSARGISTVSSMAFFASPALHNPLPASLAWQDTVAYGGSYYGERYAKRTAALLPLLQAASERGLTLYDRQHDNPASPYRFPDNLASHVQGGLSYPQMVQAYKAHPVHINVNSVADSPTMFSRRVMEIAASGTPVLSASGQAMQAYAGKGVFFADNNTQATAALQTLQNPSARWHAGLDGVRQVYTAHTAAHRLCLMLRTAGITLAAPTPMPVWVLVPNMTLQAAQAVLMQSEPPQCVLAVQWQEAAKQLLQQQGIQTALVKPIETAALLIVARNADILCQAEQNDFLDLQLSTLYSPYSTAAFCRDTEPMAGSWPGLTTLVGKPDFSLTAFSASPALLQQADEQTLLTQIAKNSKQGTCLLIRKPVVSPTLSLPPRKRNLLIAGHDLKFIAPFYPALEQAGFNVLIDQWQGHQQHDAEQSLQLLKQADIIFCEWMLGNALWYARHKLPSQRLFGRLHLQELQLPMFQQLNLSAFEKVFIVSEHILAQATAKHPAYRSRMFLLHNAVNVQRFKLKTTSKVSRKVLGIAGIVPQRKRFDLALDVLAELRKTDADYVLRVKGKLPADFAWMQAHRPDEMAWFDKQFARIEQDPLLQGAVYFDGHGDDMPQWYQQLDVILSTSDFESFHYSVAEGAACGCQPVIFNWEGAATLYPQAWCVEDVAAAYTRIQQLSLQHGAAEACETKQQLHDWIHQRYGLNSISSRLIKHLQLDTTSNMGNTKTC